VIMNSTKQMDLPSKEKTNEFDQSGYILTKKIRVDLIFRFDKIMFFFY